MQYEDRPVLVANVQEQDVRLKPTYLKSKGRMEGSYIRTGDGDYRLTPYEIDRFIESQTRISRNDLEIVPDAVIEDLDPQLLKRWMEVQRSGSFGGTASMTDEQLMINRRVVIMDEQGILRPTIAGLMALGSFPQKYFPRLNVTFTVFEGSIKGRSVAGRRFKDSENIEGPIPAMLLGSLRAISRNIRHGAIVQNGLRKDILEYPLDAIREAVANALMHRDYSMDVIGTPVRVELYPDRLEIINPGGLFGPLTVEDLGKSGTTQSRNQFLSRILEDVPYEDVDGRVGRVVENRGTGYAIIRNSLEEALMDEPIAESSFKEFRILIRHRKMTDSENLSYSRKNTEAAILAFLAEHKSASTSELANASGISRKTILDYLSRLQEEGIVEGIGSLYSPQRRYRLARN